MAPKRPTVALNRSPSELSLDDAACRIQAHYRGYKVRQKYNMESRTETMRLLAGDTSRSLTSEYSAMKKNRGHTFAGIPWLYIVGANSVLVNIILAWVFMNVPDTAYNGIDHHRTLAGSGMPPPYKSRYVGFMILGGNRSNLQQSMDQRITQAFKKFKEICNKPGYQGVFFPTGNNHPKNKLPEASYIADEIDRLYNEKCVRSECRYLQEPIIVPEGRAQFTVDNFLKTIPLVADYQREHKIKFEIVYLVTNEYHMGRSEAIVEQFKHHALVDFSLASCAVPKRINDNDRDEWLDEVLEGGQTRDQKIRNDTGRDITNSASFARAIFMKAHEHLNPLGREHQSSLKTTKLHVTTSFKQTYKCDQYKYVKANLGGKSDWAKSENRESIEGKLKQFNDLVKAFVKLYKKGHTVCNGKCAKVAEEITSTKNNLEILANLHTLVSEDQGGLP